MAHLGLDWLRPRCRIWIRKNESIRRVAPGCLSRDQGWSIDAKGGWGSHLPRFDFVS